MTTATIIAPKSLGKVKFSNLRNLEHPVVYQLIVTYLQNEYLDLRIVDDMTAEPGTNILFAARSTRVLPFITKDGIRFGSATATRTDTDQFAGIAMEREHVLPCKILYHFEIHLPPSQDHVIYVSAVQKCIIDETIPMMPWDLLCVIPFIHQPSSLRAKCPVQPNLVQPRYEQMHSNQFKLYHPTISHVR